MAERPSLDARKAEVLRRLTLSGVVEPHVKLSGSAASTRRRGKCPFHGSNSPSFALFDADKGSGGAFCFGCQWSGDLFGFLMAINGWDFVTALAEAERMAGCVQVAERGSATRKPAGTGPITRERNPVQRRDRQMIAPLDMARALWREAATDLPAIRRYFLGRGVPGRVLTDVRLAGFRYHADCPCVAWPLDDARDWRKRPPGGIPTAAAIMVMVRVPLARADGALPDFVPTGLHVTYLNPAGDGTMVRRKPWAKADDPDPMLPKRRMLGPVGGGAVLLGDYAQDAPLFVGEGNETVLSAMALAGAPEEAVGVATLSLDNLQGAPLLWKNRDGGRIWPLHAIAPDPERGCFTIPGHRGPVTGLVDSDMSELRGTRDRRSGEFLGEAVVERKGGPVVRRPITGAERAQICGELLVKGWRASGVPDVRAIRAPAGMDFNDAVRELVS